MVETTTTYTPAGYSHELFTSLQPLGVVYRTLKEREINREVLEGIRRIFRTHKMARSLGLAILHRHFDLEPSELLVEYGRTATPWPIPNTSDAYPEVLGGKIVPRSWKFHEGELLPTEFTFYPPYSSVESGKSERHPPVEFPKAFVSELGELLVRERLDDIFGLVVMDHVDIEEFFGVERTIGRVSITMPVPARSPIHPGTFVVGGGSGSANSPLEAVWENVFEAVWTFGCHESMNNSGILPARVCWVCDACK